MMFNNVTHFEIKDLNVGPCSDDFWDTAQTIASEYLPEVLARLTQAEPMQRHVQCLQDTDIDIIGNQDTPFQSF